MADAEMRTDGGMAGNAGEPRVITPNELAQVVVLMRQVRKWSQEQLAEISRLTVRTIQRVERGDSSSVDTRRALARAFEAEDIDCFNKPYQRITAEDVQAAKEKLERENITLAVSAATGKRLAELAEAVQADLIHAVVDLPREAEEVFAALADYWREFRDASELYSQVDKLDIHDELQSMLDELQRLKFSVRYAEREVAIKLEGAADAKPTRWKVGYLVAFPLGAEPDEIYTPRRFEFKL